MKCPQCHAVLVKAFIECSDHSGWTGAWLCDCDKRDYETNQTAETGSIIFIHADKSNMGAQVDKIFGE